MKHHCKLKLNILLLNFLLFVIFNSNEVECKKKSTSTEKPYDNRELLFTENNLENSSLLIGAFNLRKFGLPKVQNETVLNSLVKVIN